MCRHLDGRWLHRQMVRKKTLEKLGILPDAIENAGKASKILDRLDKRRREGLTTPKQIRFLESRGFQHVGTWQFETAKKYD